jgi:hypothetical protein
MREFIKFIKSIFNRCTVDDKNNQKTELFPPTYVDSEGVTRKQSITSDGVIHREVRCCDNPRCQVACYTTEYPNLKWKGVIDDLLTD